MLGRHPVRGDSVGRHANGQAKGTRPGPVGSIRKRIVRRFGKYAAAQDSVKGVTWQHSVASPRKAAEPRPTDRLEFHLASSERESVRPHGYHAPCWRILDMAQFGKPTSSVRKRLWCRPDEIPRTPPDFTSGGRRRFQRVSLRGPRVSGDPSTASSSPGPPDRASKASRGTGIRAFTRPTVHPANSSETGKHTGDHSHASGSVPILVGDRPHGAGAARFVAPRRAECRRHSRVWQNNETLWQHTTIRRDPRGSG